MSQVMKWRLILVGLMVAIAVLMTVAVNNHAAHDAKQSSRSALHQQSVPSTKTIEHKINDYLASLPMLQEMTVNSSIPLCASVHFLKVTEVTLTAHAGWISISGRTAGRHKVKLTVPIGARSVCFNYTAPPRPQQDNLKITSGDNKLQSTFQVVPSPVRPS